MRVCIAKKSKHYKWERGGDDIFYGRSRLVRRSNADKSRVRYYNMLTFTYEFTEKEDKVYFSYCYPYTFSML